MKKVISIFIFISFLISLSSCLGVFSVEKNPAATPTVEEFSEIIPTVTLNPVITKEPPVTMTLEPLPTATIIPTPQIVFPESVLSRFDFYIPDRFERYNEFAVKNPGFSADDILLKVNMNLDFKFYSKIFQITAPGDVLVLCNKYNQLPSDFVPSTLVNVPREYHKDDGRTYLLQKTALDAFIEMAEAAKADGVVLIIASAYRSFSYQKTLYNNYAARDGVSKADRYSARAGHSEHQTGLAFDLNPIAQSFENTDEFTWMSNNAYRYGFILRYKKGYEMETGYMYEPWHFRYVGLDAARQIFEEDITFDLYYAKYVLR